MHTIMRSDQREATLRNAERSGTEARPRTYVSRYGADRMLTGRISKTVVVVAIAFLFSLVAFGNITDYRANLPFVQHVLLMDTVFPSATTRYRVVEAPAPQQAVYILIIAVEVISAARC